MIKHKLSNRKDNKMSHFVESMFYVKQEPWHGLGIRLEDAPATSQEAIVAAELDWNVKLQNLYSTDNRDPKDIKVVNVEDYYGVQRQDNMKILGVVKSRYQPLQNIEAFDFFDKIIDAKLGEYHTAGSLKDGRIIWVLVKLGQEKQVVKGDLLSNYILLSNSHDGTKPVNIQFTPIRVVCWNTLSYAEAEDTPRLRVMHTKSLKGNLDQVKAIIDVEKKRFEATIEQYMRLAISDIDQKDLQRYVRLVFRPDEEDLSKDGEKKRIEKPVRNEENIINIFESDETCNLKGMKNSWWSAYNAVTQFVDHDRGNSQDTRLHAAWFGAGKEIKERALNLALAMSGKQ